MQSRIISTLLLMLLASPAQPSHIDATSIYSLHAVAEVSGSTGNWRSYNGTGIDSVTNLSLISDTASTGVNDTVVFNTFAWSEDDSHSTITLGFGTAVVSNQPGHDLAIFSVGPATIDVTISGISVRHSSSTVEIGGAIQGVYSDNFEYLDTLDVILIDLESYAGLNQMNQLTIDALTEIENPLAWPGISAVGAFNTTVVPLPLPILLFASGLAMLGMLGRRRPRI